LPPIVVQSDRPRESARARNGRRVILYVEGPRDRSILRAWSYRLMPSSARALFGGSVILGGRRPARALEHFRGEAGARALCVLDRDDGSASAPPTPEEPGLEFFTWGRRHIESYLLVPGAIRRAMNLREDDARIERILRVELPGGDEGAYRDVDAKRLLGPNGALARVLGRPLPLSRIARATRESELHADVHALFDRIRAVLGIAGPPRVLR
jgi:hypothetical protein